MTSSPLFICVDPASPWRPVLQPMFESLMAGRLVGELATSWHDQILTTHAWAGRSSSQDACLQPVEYASLQALRPAGDGAWAAMLPGMSWVTDELARTIPGGRYLVIVESPEEALLSWLMDQDGLDAGDTLARWSDSAQRLAHAVQHHPDRFMLVIAAELRRQPTMLVGTVCRWLDMGWDESLSVVEPVGPPPALEAVATLFAARDPASKRLYGELFACSTPLFGDELQRYAVPALSLRAGVEQLRTWAQAAPKAPALEAQVGLLLAEAARHGPLLNAAVARAEANEAEVDKLLDALATTRCDAADALQEAELMRVQLHQLFGELESFYRASRGEHPALERGDHVIAAVERVDFGPERDAAPHREYGMVLHGVRHGGRRMRRLDLRLVEHHGLPGLVLFAEHGEEPPLQGWQPHGDEAGRSFVLLIPSDPACLPALAHLGTADWLFLLAVARAVQAAILGNAGPLPARWRVAATRTCEQLAALTPRFRYDNLLVELSGEARPAFEAVFQNVLFGQRRLPDVRLTWRPAASTAQLELHGPASDDQPPSLSHWPTTQDGRWQARWQVPVDASIGADQRARLWARMPPADRELLLCLLDALPAVARRAATGSGGQTHDADALVAVARQLLRRAQSALKGSALRRIVRAVRRRMPLNRSSLGVPPIPSSS